MLQFTNFLQNHFSKDFQIFFVITFLFTNDYYLKYGYLRITQLTREGNFTGILSYLGENNYQAM